MKRALTAAIAVLVLNACAGPRYDTVERAGGGRYYLAQTPASIVHYSAAETSLFAYGLSPWWGYRYYSPYFHPYYFGFSYSSWPYYAPWPYHSYGYGARSFWYPPYPRHAHRHPGQPPGEAVTVMPPALHPGPPAGVPVRGGERLRVMDDRGLQRESRVGALPAPRVTAPVSPARAGHRAAGAGRPGAPSVPTTGAGLPTRGEAGSATVPRRNSRRHDQ